MLKGFLKWESTLWVWEQPYILRTDLFYVLRIWVMSILITMSNVPFQILYHLFRILSHFPPWSAWQKLICLFENTAQVSPPSGILYRLQQRELSPPSSLILLQMMYPSTVALVTLYFINFSYYTMSFLVIFMSKSLLPITVTIQGI